MVEQHEVDGAAREHGADLFGLARADAHRGIGTRPANDDPGLRIEPRRSGERVEFVEGVFAARPAAEGDADQQAADGSVVGAQFS